MRLRLAHHYSTPPDAVGPWPWVWVAEALELVSELNFLRDFHVTQAGIFAASAFGGLKNVKVPAMMHPGSVPETMREGGGNGWNAAVLESAAAEQDFRLAVQVGVVSQFVFAALTG